MSSVGEQLYERFSDLVSRHLGTEINWMGYLGYYQEAHVPSLQFTALQAIQGFSRNPGCEKIKEEFVQSLRVILPGVFGSEVHQQGA